MILVRTCCTVGISKPGISAILWGSPKVIATIGYFRKWLVISRRRRIFPGFLLRECACIAVVKSLIILFEYCFWSHNDKIKIQIPLFGTVPLHTYRKISNNWTMCYVFGVAPSGKVWCFFIFSTLLRGADQLFFCRDFPPSSELGNSWLHGTLSNYLRFYGSLPGSSIRHILRVFRSFAWGIVCIPLCISFPLPLLR